MSPFQGWLAWYWMFRRSDTKAVWKMLKHIENSFRIQSLSTVIRLVPFKTRLKWDPSVFREIFSARGASNLPSGSRWWVVPGWKIRGSSLHAIYKIWELGSWLWCFQTFSWGWSSWFPSLTRISVQFLIQAHVQLFICLFGVHFTLVPKCYKALVSIHLVSIHFQNATKI